MKHRFPIYKLRLYRERWLDFPPFVADQPQVAALFFHRLIGLGDREHSAALFLDERGQATGATVIGIGSLGTVAMPAREVFKAALLANASKVVLAHSHPGNTPNATDQDVVVTRKLVAAGIVVGIKVLDHLIICPSGEFVSIKESGLLPSLSTS